MAAFRIVFLGSDDFSTPILRALLECGPSLSTPVEVVAIVTQLDRPAGRGRVSRPGPVKRTAQSVDLDVLQPPRVGSPESVAQMASLSPDVFVVASFGQILPTRVLRIPSRGCLNLHPSLLPRYRGPAPIATPILLGDAETGTSVMEMVRAMDAGPVVAQVRTAIDDRETAGDLRDRLSRMSADLLLQTLPRWLAGTAIPTPQREDMATYTSTIAKADAEVDWTRPAAQIARAVRAYNPWPVAFTRWRDLSVRIFRAVPLAGEAVPGQVVGLDGDRLAVGTGAGLLGIEEVQLAGGKRLAAADLTRGRPDLLSARFEVRA